MVDYEPGLCLTRQDFGGPCPSLNTFEGSTFIHFEIVFTTSQLKNSRRSIQKEVNTNTDIYLILEGRLLLLTTYINE